MAYTEPYVGKRRQVSFIREATYGTKLTTTKWVGLDVKISESNSQQFIDFHGAGSDTLNIETRIPGPSKWELGIEYVPQDANFLSLIASSSTVTGSGNYTHTFVFGKTICSCSLDVADRHTATDAYITNFVRGYSGVEFRSMSINFSEGEPIKVNIDAVAQTCVNSASVQTITAATTNPYMYHDGILTYGTEFAQVKSGTFTINRKQVEPRYVNSTTGNDLSEPIVYEMEFLLDLTLQVTNNVFWDFFKAGVKQAGGATYTLSFYKSATENIVITFTDLYLNEDNISGEYEATLTQDLKFKAKSVAIVAIDGIATYYTGETAP